MSDDNQGFIVSEEEDRVVFEITDDAAFGAFQAGRNDNRQWNRHPITTELKKIASETRKHNNLVVKFKDQYVRIK